MGSSGSNSSTGLFFQLLFEGSKAYSLQSSSFVDLSDPWEMIL